MKAKDLKRLMEIKDIIYDIGIDFDLDRIDEITTKRGKKLQAISTEMYDILLDYKVRKQIKKQIRNL